MKSVSQIEGLMCQNFKLIFGGHLILYLGETYNESGMTEWRLNIDSAWRLDGPDGPLLGSFDTLDCERVGDKFTDRCLSILKTLIGRKIRSATQSSPVADLLVDFEGNYALTTFSHLTKGEVWELRHRSGKRYGVVSCAYIEWQEDADSS